MQIYGITSLIQAEESFVVGGLCQHNPAIVGALPEATHTCFGLLGNFLQAGELASGVGRSIMLPLLSKCPYVYELNAPAYQVSKFSLPGRCLCTFS